MAYPTSITKTELTGAANGLGIKVAATSSPGTTIHTANAPTGVNNYDEVWLQCYNSDTVARELVLQWGGTTSPDNDIKVTIQPKTGLVWVVQGLILNNSLLIKAYCTTTNVLVLSGFVNRITA